MGRLRDAFVLLILGASVACGRADAPSTPATPASAPDSLAVILPNPPPPVVTPAEQERLAEDAFPATVLRASAWQPYTADGARLAIAPAEATGPVRMDFDFGTGTWLGAWTELPLAMTPYAGLRIRYARTGSRNTIELKIEDADGSTFGLRLPAASDDALGREVEFRFAALEHWWGGDARLDLARCKFHVAQVRKGDDPGGKGQLVLEAVELMKAPAPPAR